VVATSEASSVVKVHTRFVVMTSFDPELMEESKAAVVGNLREFGSKFGI
jgi:hypothetical protein